MEGGLVTIGPWVGSLPSGFDKTGDCPAPSVSIEAEPMEARLTT